MPDSFPISPAPLPLDLAKFQDPAITTDGSRRAQVAFRQLATLWFNTGTLCNITCANCYIESSPTNDRLEYLTLADVKAKLDEIRDAGLATTEIGFTGGEPFMNPDMLAMLALTLDRGFKALVLTNAMRPMQKARQALDGLNRTYPGQMTIRVSLDHYATAFHEEERGANTWAPTMQGLKWLASNNFDIDIAGRMRWEETEPATRQGFQALFDGIGVDIDAGNPARLVLFPEMDESQDVPEITEACWGILNVSPDAVMCASSRMVVRHKGADQATVAACTLIPYDKDFDMGTTLVEASQPVALNHPHCARFCVLGGASCSA
jgi:organic radical activating enzyme